MERLACLDDVVWVDVVERLISPGWARLGGVVDPVSLEALEGAAPGRWASLPETEGSAGVRQAGIADHCSVVEASAVVRRLAKSIEVGIDAAGSAVPPLPVFNHAEWCRAERGLKFITAHRDPQTAGGVVAVLTIRGRAVFRIWDLDGSLEVARGNPELATSWSSEDGDLVLMRSGGWPLATSRCPIHEAESPIDGDRVTLTLRHNKGGYGADYFV